MSETTTAVEPQVTTVASTDIETPPPAAPAAAPPTEPDQAWLKDRLARSEESARKKLMAELGVDDPETAKKAIAAAKAAEEEQKTLAEKLAESSTKATEAATTVESLRATLKGHADAMLAGLTDEQKESVQAIAGDDAQRIVDTVTALKWGPSATPKPAVPAPPVDTAPARTAPDGTSESPPDYKAKYESLRKENEYAAAVYMNRHAAQIYAD